jgi:hypothetical protein
MRLPDDGPVPEIMFPCETGPDTFSFILACETTAHEPRRRKVAPMPDRRTILQAAGIASLINGAFGLTAAGNDTRDFVQPASPVAGVLSAEDPAGVARLAPASGPTTACGWGDGPSTARSGFGKFTL